MLGTVGEGRLVLGRGLRDDGGLQSALRGFVVGDGVVRRVGGVVSMRLSELGKRGLGSAHGS